MVNHLFPDFLKDIGEYRKAEEFWMDLWLHLDSWQRHENRWTCPWLSTGAESIRDGNPIFSAWSPKLRRGIRVVQYGPTQQGVEFFAYPDTFGGTIYDPMSIKELVISCALSDVAAVMAEEQMERWIVGKNSRYEERGPGLASSDAPSIDDYFRPAA